MLPWPTSLTAEDEVTGGDSDWHRAAQIGPLIQAGVVGIAIILMILVYDQVNGSLPTPTDGNLSNASSNATGTFSSSMELAPVIVLVLIASVVIAIVQRFR